MVQAGIHNRKVTDGNGRNRVDKIREEFEKEYDVIEFRLDSDFPVFEAGYKSRDREVDGYKSDIKARAELRREQTRMLKIKCGETAELHESCNNYKKMYVDKMEEVKKLEKSLKEVLENIKYFTDRVEAGTIRSRKTYAIYKNLLAKYEKVSQVTWDLLPEDKKALKEGE